MSRTRLLIPILALAAASLGPLSACASDPTKGYAFGTAHDQGIESVAVPIFKNRTQARGIETTITEALIKQIQQRTPWVVSDTSRADTTLEGSLSTIHLRQLSQTPRTGLVQEQAVTLTVQFQWRDNRTGEILTGRTGFSASATFVPEPPVSERIEHAQRQAAEQLARDIVSQLRSGW